MIAYNSQETKESNQLMKKKTQSKIVKMYMKLREKSISVSRTNNRWRSLTTIYLEIN